MKLRKTQFNAGDPTIQIYYTHEEPNLMHKWSYNSNILYTQTFLIEDSIYQMVSAFNIIVQRL